MAGKKRVVFITPVTPRVGAALAVVGKGLVALDDYGKAHRARMEAPGAPARWEESSVSGENLREGVRVIQAGYALVARFQASHEAWKRVAKWATEERLEADAQTFGRFVQRECQLLAPVVRLQRLGEGK